MAKQSIFPALTQLAAQVHKANKDKGFYDNPLSLVEQLALVHSEVSEAVEAERAGDSRLRIADNGKPEGVPSELADVVIRVLDICGHLGIDIGDAIERKLAYNATRPYKHGKKF